MKHLLILCIGTCFLAMEGKLCAQTLPFSQVVRHTGTMGTEVITRATPSSMVLTCNRSADGDGKHTFTYTSPSTGHTEYFSCNLGTLFSNSSDIYHIKDLYLFEDRCYFCGYYSPSDIEPVYDYAGNIIHITTYGFIGYFDLFAFPSAHAGSVLDPLSPPGPPLTNGMLDSVYMIVIPETDSIMQLVAHRDAAQVCDAFLMAVGYTSYYPLSTCVVELTKPVGTYDTYWTLNIVQPTCSETDEYMTDIVLTESHVTVASKLPYADGELDGDADSTHYLFRLHEAKRDGFYNTTLPFSSASVYQYDVSSFGVGIGCHHIGDPIRLCPLNGNRFCVYYHEWRRYTYPYDDLGGSSLFWMNEAGTMEHAAHTYGVYSHTKEAVWVGDTDKTNDYGPCLAQRIQGVNLESIDCNPSTQYLYIGGTYPDKKLCHGFQNEILYCDYYPTCLINNSNEYTLLSKKESVEEYCDWSVQVRNKVINAQKSTVELSTYDAEIICTQEIDQ